MAAARLAPVLSATSRIERIWSINRETQLNSHGGHAGTFFDNFDQTPAFALRERPRFLDADAVTDFGLVFLVVGIEFFVAGNDFLVSRMGKATLDAHDDGLGHLIRDDLAQPLFAI